MNGFTPPLCADAEPRDSPKKIAKMLAAGQAAGDRHIPWEVPGAGAAHSAAFDTSAGWVMA